MTQLSSLDLYYLLQEMDLENAKIDQIYELGKKDIILQFHKTGIGKIKLRITPPEVMYLTNYKPEVSSPKHFVMTLRKHLGNSFLRQVKQIGFERIVELEFDTRTGKRFIYIELFSKGNIILTDENLNILAVAEHQRWAERHIRPSIKYTYPKREHNLLKLSKQELKDIVGKDKIGKVLAAELGLGKLYSDEILLISEIDKNKVELTAKEITAINKALKDLIREPEPIISDNKPYPIPLRQIKDFKKTESYNRAIDNLMTKTQKTQITKAAESKHDKQIVKVQRIIDTQSEQIKNLKETEVANKKIGELIYKSYQEINDILTQMKEARKTMSWKEIKDKLKNPKIKEINEKTGKITLDL